MRVFVNLGTLLSKVLDYFVDLRSERLFNLIVFVLLVFSYSAVVCFIFDQLITFFQQNDNAYLYENNDSVFLLKLLSMSRSIYSISFLTLGLFGPWILKRIKGEELESLMSYIYTVKSNKWLAYFLLVIGVYILYSLPVSSIYELNSIYAYTHPDFSYVGQLSYAFMQLAIPFLTILGVYRLACFEIFTFKALLYVKNSVFVLLLAILLFYSIEQTLFEFIDSFIAVLLGFLFERQLTAILFFGGLKLIVMTLFIGAKLVAVFSIASVDLKVQRGLRNATIEDDDILDII